MYMVGSPAIASGTCGPLEAREGEVRIDSGDLGGEVAMQAEAGRF